MNTEGHVIFIGAGPGAADLITLRGARALAQADVVLFDALTDPLLREFAPKANWIHVGKRGFCDSVAQTQINALLVQSAQAGLCVVRLKGGDPSVFGRLEEELLALAQAGILKGHRFTMHWDNIDAFAENHPQLLPARQVFC